MSYHVLSRRNSKATQIPSSLAQHALLAHVTPNAKLLSPYQKNFPEQFSSHDIRWSLYFEAAKSPGQDADG
eukprot:3589447-Amphidinium_carterae.1